MLTDFLNKRKEYSFEILENIKTELEKNINNENICIVTTGSYARGEASEESDLDFYVIVKNGDYDLAFDEKELIQNVINKYIKNDSGDSGTFGSDAIEKLETMLKNIGGTKDTNIKLTRRMLFLLESKCLYNEQIYNDVMKRLLSVYIKEAISYNQIARFLLNDIIRYYRTITTDFEYKINEEGKSWGLRYIKLTYSRKLIYFAGIISIAQTQDKNREEKIDILMTLFNKIPLERIDETIKDSNIKSKIFELYENFLIKISDIDIRKELESIRSNNNELPQNFEDLKNKSKEFSRILIKAIKETFDKNHRIHEAILF